MLSLNFLFENKLKGLQFTVHLEFGQTTTHQRTRLRTDIAEFEREEELDKVLLEPQSSFGGKLQPLCN